MSGDDLEMVRRRGEFTAVLRQRVLVELGIPKEEAPRYLADGCDVRWQTAQSWLEGKSFPLGANLRRLSKFIGVAEAKLVGPMIDEAPPEAFTAFLKTPEGSSMTDLERWAVRLFPWHSAPTLGDYRQLLALYRANAERP
jgi:hypothetical protein